MLCDTHCHLYFDSFDADREEVLERAQRAGINRILVPGINIETSRAAVALAESVPEVFAAVGVHPNEANTWDNDSLDELLELAHHPKVVAIGEIGLDFYRQKASKSVQLEIFQLQLQFAKEMNLPVAIHIRDGKNSSHMAIGEVLSVLQNWKGAIAFKNSQSEIGLGVLHSYSGDREASKRAVELGFYIGVSGPITFHNATRVREVVSDLPIQRCLIETDAPFLTPVPYRGERNEPAFVRFIADEVARIKKMTVYDVQKTTSDNASKLFHW